MISETSISDVNLNRFVLTRSAFCEIIMRVRTLRTCTVHAHLEQSVTHVATNVRLKQILHVSTPDAVFVRRMVHFQTGVAGGFTDVSAVE